MSTPTSNHCPECGNPLPPESPHHLCPACLMAQALASRTGDNNEHFSFPSPPEPADIARHFPNFEILECLGRGGMGIVYKARQKSLNRLVAIKILAPEREHDARFAERFAREAELLARLSHPHIVTIHDFGETGGLYYLVMEFVDGVNLRDLLRDGKLEPKQALAIVPAICEALQYAHEKGIVHRDIKPENLLLDRAGRIKIADFGIASLIGANDETSGTPPYMAPEQSKPSSAIDHRADIYALGVVFYEMLTGERPAQAVIAPSKRVQIDVRIDEMVLRALEKDPDRRYQTAAEFRTAVQTIVPEPSIAKTAVVAVPPAETSRFSPIAIAGVCCFIFLLPLVDTWRQWQAVSPRGFSISRNFGALLTVTEVFYGTLIAVLGMTILGWMAISQIRRSSGKLHGMWLAVFDALFYPLLVLNIVLAILVHAFGVTFHLWSQYYSHRDNAKLTLASLHIWSVVDFFLVRAVWRKVNRPAPSFPVISPTLPG